MVSLGIGSFVWLAAVVRGRWMAGRQAAVCITGSLGSCLRSPVVPEARWSRWALRRGDTPLLPFCSSAWWQGTGALHSYSLVDEGLLCSGVKILSVLSKMTCTKTNAETRINSASRNTFEMPTRPVTCFI